MPTNPSPHSRYIKQKTRPAAWPKYSAQNSHLAQWLNLKENMRRKTVVLGEVCFSTALSRCRAHEIWSIFMAGAEEFVVGAAIGLRLNVLKSIRMSEIKVLKTAH